MSSEDYFQRLTAGATFSRTFNVFAKRLDLFLLISALLFVPLVAMSITVVSSFGSSMKTIIDTMNSSHRYLQQTYYDNSNYESRNYDTYSGETDLSNLDQQELANEFLAELGSNIQTIAVQLLIEMLVYFVFALAAEAAIIYAVGQLYVDHNPRVSECLKKGFSKWCTLFGASLLVSAALQIGNYVFGFVANILMEISNYFGVVVFGGFVAWIVFEIYVFVSLIILSPAIVIENFGPTDAIKRAWSLAQNNRCYIFCTLFCFAVAYYTLIIVINSIISSVAGKEAIFSTWGIFVAMLPSIVYLPLSLILKTVVYLNIRVQREGMNRGVLMNDLDGMLAGEIAAAVITDDPSKYSDGPSITVTKADIV